MTPATTQSAAAAFRRVAASAAGMAFQAAALRSTAGTLRAAAVSLDQAAARLEADVEQIGAAIPAETRCPECGLVTFHGDAAYPVESDRCRDCGRRPRVYGLVVCAECHALGDDGGNTAAPAPRDGHDRNEGKWIDA